MPESTSSEPLGAAANPERSADTAASEKADPKARVLLWQVLSEEYESLQRQPAGSIDSNDDQNVAIKDEVTKYCAGVKASDDKANARVVSEIYRKMEAAQRRTAKAEVEKWAKYYKEKYQSASEQLTVEQLEKVIDRAVVAEVYGHIQDLRWKYQQKYADIDDKTKRAQEVERKILKAICLEALGEKAICREALGEEEPTKASQSSTTVAPPTSIVPAPDELKESLKGTGSGKTTSINYMSQEGAAKVLAQTLRSALCLSGGGIRSATFNLGILQGLARHGLLEQFDYLSTVSGGGFIGGWLSAWICREGIDPVMRKMGRPSVKQPTNQNQASPPSPFDPDPRPIEHLRVYSNYLSPRPGLLSADTWTLIATVLRNLMLNWLVFVPVLVLLLLLPRMWTAILLRSTKEAYAPFALKFYFVLGIVSAVWTFIYIGTHLPSARTYSSNPCDEKYKSDQGSFIAKCLVWMTISAACFAITFRIHPLARYQYVLLTEGILLVPWFFCMFKIVRTKIKRQTSLAWSLPLATLLIMIAQLVTGYLLNHAIGSFLPGPGSKELLYAMFSVPMILIVMSVGASLIAGFTSHFTNDDDQEWWARAGAWMAIVIVAWCVLNLLVLYGPLLILTLGATFKGIYDHNGFRHLSWPDIGKLLGMVAGVVSGVITLVGGFSAKTPANAKEAQKAGVSGILLSFLTTLLAPIFLAFVLIMIALGTNWLLANSIGQAISCRTDWAFNLVLGMVKQLLGSSSPFAFAGGNLPSPFDHYGLLKATSLRYLVVTFLLVGLATVVLGRLINTNIFSLQYLWRNRIIRAYLGASRKKRCPDSFTGFDVYDNLYMSELREQPLDFREYGLRNDRAPDDRFERPNGGKLLHILNLALNLTGGEKLQWQDRRAESFTVSPFHAGSYWLGYRRSFCYGGEEGISLGAAVAISGAFASPNMGYMMTSPVVRFLMTLFNVRFGWWLGNPGPAGDKTSFLERIVDLALTPLGLPRRLPFQQRSPGLSVVPIVSEAFGSIDDKSSYVYLSDGGHFENLGLYEMVLRRCRFIVVSDASTDPDYSFQSLAMSVRQIRVDLGVPIDLPELDVSLPAQDMKGKYCAIGKIRYSCVDRDPNDAATKDEDFDGVLIYIKPSLIGEEPRDVINYWQGSNGFPQESIVDQWFSESQFESYRALGSHIIDVICGGDRNEVNLAAFARKVREHNQLDFRAFRNQISYLALKEQFKEMLQQNRVPSFTWKVKQFFEKLLR